MTAQYGPWPPGAPATSVTFAAVAAALATASTPVAFNSQALTGVAAVNGLELRANADDTGIAVGNTAAPLPVVINRLAIGKDALAVLGPTVVDALAIGNRSQIVSTAGNRCVSLGHRSLEALTVGNDNVAIGTRALASLTTGTNNVAIGTIAGVLNNGADNVFIGHNVAALATDVATSVCIGSGAGGALTTGDDNTFVGRGAGQATTTALSNTFIGALAGAAATATQQACVCIGAGSAPPNTGDNGFSVQNALWGDLTTTGTGPKFLIGPSAAGLAAQVAKLGLRLSAGSTDASPLMDLNSSAATNGASALFLSGNRDPNGAVSSPGGSFYFRVSGATSGLYINRTAGTGTSWSLVTAVP